VVVKSQPCQCVCGNWLLSNPVTFDHLQYTVNLLQEMHDMRGIIAAQDELIKIMDEHLKLHKTHQATASATDREM